MNNYHLRRNKTASSQEKKKEYEKPPDLSLMVNMDPPPMPMLWGLTTDVHRRAAMAPSTADPPCWSMLLENTSSHQIYGKCVISQSVISPRDRTHSATNTQIHTHILQHSHDVSVALRGSVWCHEGILDHAVMLEADPRKKTEKSLVFRNSHSELTTHLLQLGLCNLTLK